MKWELKEINKSELKPNPNNPKIRNEKGMQRLRKSLEKFGNVFDGIVNADYTIIDGHSRFEVSKSKTVRVFVPEKQLSDKEVTEMNGIFDIARAGDIDFGQLQVNFEEFDIDAEEWDIEFINADNYGTDFNLPGGDKAPFQQMTFTLADEQAEQIKNAIADIKQTDEYKFAETMGNENSNGNALYLIIMQWAEQKK